jgi:malate permease and related proteins
MFEIHAIQAVAILILLIFLGMGLREWGILKEEFGGVLSRIIVNVTIPALIFSALSTVQFEPDKLMLAVVMILSQLISALLAWLVSQWLKLSQAKRGALILASTFTSSAFLGYAVVKEVYHGNVHALADAAVVSELGVATLLFTFGVFLAMHFGTGNAAPRERMHTMLSFFYSPIFIALVAGIICSFIPIPRDNLIVGGIYDGLHIIADANTFLVALTIGVMMHFKDLRHVWKIVALVVVIKLIIQPLLSYTQAHLYGFSELWTQIVVLEAAMPTAAMTAIFARKYGCDAELTSILVFATFISSCITMFGMIVIL